MKKYQLSIISAASLLLPIAAVATTLDDFLDNGLKPVLESIVNVLVVLAIFVLIVGIFRYMTAAGDEEQVKKGKNFIVYGIIGIVLMLTIRAFINIIVDTFLSTGGLEDENVT